MRSAFIETHLECCWPRESHFSLEARFCEYGRGHGALPTKGLVPLVSYGVCDFGGSCRIGFFCRSLAGHGELSVELSILKICHYRPLGEAVNPPSLVVAGGGTGGHVLAGVAVADAWRARHGASAEIRFVGAEGGIETQLVPRAGYKLHLLKLGSLNRVSLSRKLRTFGQLPRAIFSSIVYLLRAQPDAVLGVGGYASGPLVLAARILSFLGLLHAQTAILEQNSVPGLTNRILGAISHRVFVAFFGAEKSFSRGAPLVTGNPIRSAIRPMPPASVNPFVVFAFGGSQGATGINDLVLGAVKALRAEGSRVHFVHQTGERDFERIQRAHEELRSGARVEKFIYEMPEVYASASLVVCRAGSSTLAEIAAVGRAAVLVPFPFASDNHQKKRACLRMPGWFLLLQESCYRSNWRRSSGS